MKKTITVLLVLLAASSAASVQEFGTGDAKPTVQNITVYEAEPGQQTGGELIDYGLNETLDVNHNGTETYRFEFRINNTGTENWEIQPEDTLVHEGLDTGWNVSDVWYNISQQYTGGSFSSGTISWNTEEGRLDTSGENSTMYAKYLVNISGSSSDYSMEFRANDTSNSTGSRDFHTLEYTETGELNLTLDYPRNDSVVQKDRFFDLNLTAECLNGDCGNVTFNPLYNTSDSFDLIGESGTPFYVKNSSEKYCTLSSSEECVVEWRVNATGAEDSYHDLKANASSEYSSVLEAETDTSTVQIHRLVYMDISWDTLDFGALEPGERNPAEGNDNSTYNVTLLEESNEADIWIKASELVNQDDSRYFIGPGNMTYNYRNSYADNRLSSSFQLLNSSVSHGTSIDTFYWLNTPLGISEGTYDGNLTIKANLTG